MSAKSLNKVREMLPSVFDDFLKPWNEWFDDNSLTKMLTVPAVNITEETDNYKVQLAAPGMEKNDFSIDVDGNMLTISASKEGENEEKGRKYTRKEYNYSSFSRTFTIPEGVKKDKIEAKYSDGVLDLTMPKNESAKSNGSQKIKVN